MRISIDHVVHAEIFNLILDEDGLTAAIIEQKTGYDRSVVDTALAALYERGFIWQIGKDEAGEWMYAVVMGGKHD